MRKIARAACCVLFVATASIAQQKPNFSGTFALTSLKGDSVAKTRPKTILKVIENDTSLVTVESFDDGKIVTSTYFLDGRESKNTTSGGVVTGGHGRG